MAEVKKSKIKTKVNAPEKVPESITLALNTMVGLYLAKPLTGEMDLLIKKKNGEIIVNEYEISESLKAAEGYSKEGDKIQESAMAELASLNDGKVRVIFDVEYEELNEE